MKESDQDTILKDLSVIVPFTGVDTMWKDLLQDLKALPLGSEIVLVGPDAPDPEILKKARDGILAEVRYVFSVHGRARALNAGARAARNGHFWFLHADSKVPRSALYQLNQALRLRPLALHFFRLKFLKDGPRWTLLNATLANWRAKHWGLPVGEQGYALTRALFFRIGGFAESESGGEDQVFVWEARRKKIPLNSVDAAIFTSARRYQAEGWARLTRARAMGATKRMAIESYKLIKTRATET